MSAEFLTTRCCRLDGESGRGRKSHSDSGERDLGIRRESSIIVIELEGLLLGSRRSRRKFHDEGAIGGDFGAASSALAWIGAALEGKAPVQR